MTAERTQLARHYTSRRETIRNFFKDKGFKERLESAAAAAREHVAKAEEWGKAQPDHWRLGDIAIVKGADPLGHGWMLVKQHPRDPKLWYCVLRDDWDSLLGSPDVPSVSELDVTGVLRCRCATWIHTDDIPLGHRIDRDSEAAAACSKMISKMFTDFAHLLEPNETDSDPDYTEHMSALLQYQYELTEYLHNRGDV